LRRPCPAIPIEHAYGLASNVVVNALTPVIVHVHEGSSGLLVALVGVAGTVLGVLLGAGTAFWRQKNALAHDRQLRELEALRVVLDDGAEALGAAKAAQVRLARLWQTWMPSAGTQPRDAKYDEAAADQRAAIGRARSVSHRLDLRLPADDEVLVTYQAAGKTLDELAEITKGAPHNFNQHRVRLVELDDALGSQIKVFLEAARTNYGPGLEPRKG
jgi:hypothetical protein